MGSHEEHRHLQEITIEFEKYNSKVHDSYKDIEWKFYNGSAIEDLYQLCQLRCYTSREMVISEINANTYLITHPKENLMTPCPESSQKLLEENEQM